jgi:hypothetical protein
LVSVVSQICDKIPCFLVSVVSQICAEDLVHPFEDGGHRFYPDDDEDLSRKHNFKNWRGKIDGTCPCFYGEA